MSEHTAGFEAATGVSSFPSKRRDMAVLCHEGGPIEPGPPTLELASIAPASAVMYLVELPLPGLAAGMRLAITEVERGMT
jgi:hypothetical protein